MWMSPSLNPLLFPPSNGVITAAAMLDPNSYLHSDIKFGEPLNYTGFRWFKIPSNFVISGAVYMRHFGSIRNEDTDLFPGIGISILPQTGGANSNCAIAVSAYSFDGLNQVLKFTARNRDTNNNVNTFPLLRDVWYCLYWSVNFDDSNDCVITLGVNGNAPWSGKYLGDTDPIFPSVPFLPTTSTGPTNLFMGVTFSLGGGEAICDQGKYDAINAFNFNDGSSDFAFNIGNNFSYYQVWDDTQIDTSLTAYQRFMTSLSHPIDLGPAGETPFGSQAFNYNTGGASDFQVNLGYGNGTTLIGSATDTVGPS